LLLATVTGIARFVSYVRSLQPRFEEVPIADRLFPIEGASHSWEFGYREEMEQFAAKVAWFTTFPQLAAPGDETDWHGETGRVDDLIRKYTDLRNLIDENSTAYLCRHPTMIENGKGILHRCSWQNEGIKEEVYFHFWQTIHHRTHAVVAMVKTRSLAMIDGLHFTAGRSVPPGVIFR